MNHPEERGTGRTTRQILAAPPGAVYVWPAYQSLSWVKSLGKRLEREDLLMVSRSWLEPRNWLGKEFSAIILDHATREVLTPREWNLYAEAIVRVKVK